MPDAIDEHATPDLIDRSAIKAADAVRDATFAADRTAHAGLRAAQEALASANAIADRAAAAGDPLDEVETAVMTAELAARSAQRRCTATAAAAADAPRIHRESVGRAHHAAAIAAIRGRISAIVAYEAAVAAQKAAENAFKIATSDLLGFANAGAPVRGALDAPRVLPTETIELAFWTARGVDVGTRV